MQQEQLPSRSVVCCTHVCCVKSAGPRLAVCWAEEQANNDHNQNKHNNGVHSSGSTLCKLFVYLFKLLSPEETKNGYQHL